MDKLVQTLRGFSGNQIYLIDDSTKLFVRKVGSIGRNVERITALAKNYPVPKIYRHSDITLDMEYIHGLDIKTYLKSNQPNRLSQFIVKTLSQLSNNAVDKDYTSVYHAKLKEVDFELLPFTAEELISKLPKHLPQSEYIGDLTLENIIYTDNGFYLIDCATTEYDSYIFDIAKLRQDLVVQWFTRSTDLMLDVKTNYINQQLRECFPQALVDNNYLLILMLLRVYTHAQKNSFEHNFLLEGIQRLWK